MPGGTCSNNLLMTSNTNSGDHRYLLFPLFLKKSVSCLICDLFVKDNPLFYLTHKMSWQNRYETNKTETQKQ